MATGAGAVALELTVHMSDNVTSILRDMYLAAIDCRYATNPYDADAMRPAVDRLKEAIEALEECNPADFLNIACKDRA